MTNCEDAIYRERCAFQRKLDETFPSGATCAVLEEVDGHLEVANVVISTGRLFCSDARATSSGSWEHQILIDPRRSARSQEQAIRVWVTGVIRESSAAHLFEADVASKPAGSLQLLRLNANPPDHVRPSKRMRSAVTKARESSLFPHGKPSARAASPSPE
jgi:hypothetical protein